MCKQACYITSLSVLCMDFIHTSHFDNVSLCLFLSPQGTSGNDGAGGPPGERVSIRYFFDHCLFKFLRFVDWVSERKSTAGVLCLNLNSKWITALCQIEWNQNVCLIYSSFWLLTSNYKWMFNLPEETNFVYYDIKW